MKVFRLDDDFRKPLRWYLGIPISNTGQELAWDFNTAKKATPDLPLFTGIRQEGRRVNFTFGGFEIPILDQAAMSVFQTYAQDCVEFFPVRVEGQNLDYYVMNILTEADCLDEQASLIRWWTPEDSQPERLGTYRGLAREVIDLTVAKLPPIFRLTKFSIRIMVTDRLQRPIEDAGLTGVICTELGTNKSK